MAADWMDSRFSRLGGACKSARLANDLNPAALSITIEGRPEPLVTGLSSAATKYRLAKYCTGLALPDPGVLEWGGIREEYFEGYSAQLIVVLSIVALETYARIFQHKWWDFAPQPDHAGVSDLAADLRKSLDKKLRGGMKKKSITEKLGKRLAHFFGGDDCEVLAVAVVIRNGFAHGDMGLTDSINFEQSTKLRRLILSLIEADIDAVIAALGAQDRSLLPSRFQS